MAFDWNGDDSYLLEQEFEEAKRRAKKKPNLIKELLADFDAPSAGPAPASVDDLFDAESQTLGRRLDRLRKEAQTRRKLHSRFVREINSQIRYAQFSLERFSGWGVGYNTGVDVKRNHLERQLQQLRTERRAAELRAWEDLVGLRKDWQHAVEEYKSLASFQEGVLKPRRR